MSRNTNNYVNPQARQALEKFKYEVANEIGIYNQIQSVGWGNMTSRECGAVGGYMTKKMVELAQQQLATNPNLTAQLAGSAGQDHRAGATLQSGQ